MKQNIVSKTVLSHISALVIIWIILPFFRLGGYDIFASEVIKILMTLIYFVVFYLIKSQKGYKINFLNADQEHGGYLSKFAESLRELVYSQTKNYKFLKGRGLYKSPWFLTLGLSDSGKTTIIKNSDIHFDFKYSETNTKANKPTFDWYSSSEATFIDINSKLIDVERVEENTLFDSVLGLIIKARRLKPIDGLIITINAEHLISNNSQELEREFSRYRVMLKKIYNLGIKDVPIYMFLSNMDKIPGFVEYFDSKTFDVTNNVLGMTLPVSKVQEPLEWLKSEYETIVSEISANIFSSIRKKHANIDSEKAFYFARYMAYLGEKIDNLLADVIYENNYSKDLYLRGLYFTAVGSNKNHHFDKSKSDTYFLKNIFKDVILKEAKKTTIFDNIIHYLSKHKNYVYSISGVAVVGLVFSWVTGYTQGSYYLSKVRHTNNTLQPLIGAPIYGPSYWKRMEKIESLAKLREVEFSSWHHFGFKFPTTTDKDLNSNYDLELERVFRQYVLKEVESNIESLIAKIKSLGSDETVDKAQKTQALYNWLMTYVMFDETEHLDVDFVRNNLDTQWESSYKNDDKTLDAFKTYLDDMLALPAQKLHSNLDSALIEKARAVLGGDIYVYRAYEQFKQKNVEEKATYKPTILGGLKYVGLFDKPVSVNYVYTIDGWDNYSKEKLVKELELAEQDQWAFDSGNEDDGADATKAKQKIFDLYWSDYANVWSQALNDIQFKHSSFEQKYTESKDNDSYIKAFEEIILQLKNNITSDVVSSTVDTDKKTVASIASFVNNDYRVNQLEDKIKLLERIVSIMSDNSETSKQQAFVLSKLIATNKQTSFVSLKNMIKELPPVMTSLVESYLGSFTYSMFERGAVYDTALWNRDLSDYCSANFASNYPFANSKDEMTLAKYKDDMSKNSKLMDYMDNNVSAFTDKDKTGILNAKEIYGVKFPFDKNLFKEMNMISQLNALAKNNNSTSSDKLNMMVGLTPVLLSGDLSGVEIIYNSKTVGYFNGPQYQQDFNWPAGNETDGTVQVLWHYKNKDDAKNIYNGQWGFIKFLSEFEHNVKDDTYTIKFGKSFATYKISTKGKGTINNLGNLDNIQCKF
jgi:type VI secretion system protein ImpL